MSVHLENHAHVQAIISPEIFAQLFGFFTDDEADITGVLLSIGHRASYCVPDYSQPILDDGILFDTIERDDDSSSMVVFRNRELQGNNNYDTGARQLKKQWC